jgi:uncharacterized coiled-coil protein SlyX
MLNTEIDDWVDRRLVELESKKAEHEFFTDCPEELREVIAELKQTIHVQSKEIYSLYKETDARQNSPAIEDEVLLSKDAVLQMVHHENIGIKGVYFLIDYPNIVYVGKSNNSIVSRLVEHWRKKERGEWTWTSYAYIEMDKSKTNTAEEAYIRKFQPRYNKQGL